METQRPLLVLGAGGHGRVLADVARAAGWYVVGFLDDGRTEAPWSDTPILGTIRRLPELLDSHPDWFALIAVGDNAVRHRVAERFPGLADRFPTVISPTAYVSSTSTLGPGTVVVHHAVIQTGVHVGAHVIVNTAATVDHDCRIGDYSHISPGAHLAGEVQVGEEAHVGIGASVLPGIRIGARAVVGAGAAVVSDVPSGARVAGVPARPLH